MIKIHLIGLEVPTAIGPGDTPKVAEELDHPGLPHTHPLQLEVAIQPVLLDVVLSLARSN